MPLNRSHSDVTQTPSFGHCHERFNRVGLTSRLVIGLTGLLCKAVLRSGLLRVTVHTPSQVERLCQLIHDQSEQRRPLITVANHVSVVDDPLLLGLLPWRTLFQPRLMRWTLSAQEIVFTSPWHLWYFGHGKAIPTVRGDGVDQLAVDKALWALRQRHWVHVFPEARVNQSGKLLATRRGVGKLVAEAEIQADDGATTPSTPLATSPLVVPIYHRGLELVLPEKRSYLRPRFGKQIDIWVGDPIDFLQDPEVAQAAHATAATEVAIAPRDLSHHGWTRLVSSDQRRELYHRITDRIELELRKLEEKYNELK